MSRQAREFLREYERKGEAALEAGYVEDVFFCFLHTAASPEETVRINHFFDRCIEELHKEYDGKNNVVRGSFAEALANRKAA